VNVHGREHPPPLFVNPVLPAADLALARAFYETVNSAWALSGLLPMISSMRSHVIREQRLRVERREVVLELREPGDAEDHRRERRPDGRSEPTRSYSGR
jgi:hypothetical protein